MDAATRLFRDLTGFTAVTSFTSAFPAHDPPTVMSPPMHPRCGSRRRTVAGKGPCEEEWQGHLRRSLASGAVQNHVCPLGLRCSCIPIYYRGMLVGVAKCVTDRGTGNRRFSQALRVLELAIAKACQDLCIDMQSRELELTRERADRFQRMLQERAMRPPRDLSSARARAANNGTGKGQRLVERALDYIARHYREHAMTLSVISRELGVTEKYLTSVFTRVVGQRMRAYILQLRVQHARRELLATRTSLKQIAYESGFNGVDTFRRSFRRYAGVAPGVYRHAFTLD